MNRIAMTLSTILALIVANLGFSSPSAAREAEVYTGFFSSLAMGGHDPVSYFKDGVPRLGDARFAMTYKGATWRFASQQNLDAFRSNPVAFAPQYGGYCAWAVSQGYTASGDPQVWNIVGGKLYLNYNKDVQANWAKDIPGHIARADKNWPTVLDK